MKANDIARDPDSFVEHEIPQQGRSRAKEDDDQKAESAQPQQYCGHLVETGLRFDLERVISLSTARDNAVIGQLSVADAIEYVRSADSRKVVNRALEYSERIQGELWWLIEHFGREGSFEFNQCAELQDLRWNQRNDVAQELTNVIKECGNRDEQAITPKLKAIAWRCAKAMRLSGFTWAGQFGVRNNHSLLKPSGLMCIDLDKLKIEIEQLIQELRSDPLIFWAGRSPSGKGVKVLVRIPDDAAKDEKHYLACFETMERYIAAKYPGVSISVDKQAKAVAQLCFFMHDPDSFCNPDAYVLHADEDLRARYAEGAKAKREKSTGTARQGSDSKDKTKEEAHGQKRQSTRNEARSFPFDSYPPDKQWETVRSAVESLEGWLAGLPSGQGERNGAWTRIGFAFGEWFKQLEDADIRQEAEGWLLELAGQYYAGNEGCVERAIEGSNGSCGLGTLFKMAKEHGGWKAPWMTEGGTGDQPQKKWVIMEHVIDFQFLLPPIKCVGDQWYEQRDGLWLPKERSEYEPVALQVLPFHLKCSKRATEVMATFQKQQQVPRSLLKSACIWEDEKQEAVLINCRNGLLRVTADQSQLIEYDPEVHCFTGQLAAAYNPEAHCHTFEHVLAEAQQDAQARELLMWWCGYILLPTLRHRCALINYGPTGTSKSTFWLYGVGSVIGDGATKNLSLSDICSVTGYSLPGLQHALLNIGGELDADELAQSSRFKLMVGGEPFEVRGEFTDTRLRSVITSSSWCS